MARLVKCLTLAILLVVNNSMAHDPQQGVIENEVGLANFETAIAKMLSEDSDFKPSLSNSNNKSDIYKSGVHFFQALTSLREMNLDDAKYQIDMAIKLSPDNPELHYINGHILFALASRTNYFSAFFHAKNSLIAYKKAQELAPENDDYLEGVFWYLVEAPFIVGGDIDEALKIAEKLQAINPKRGFLMLAKYYDAIGDYTAQLNLYSEAIDALPDDPELYFFRAEIYSNNEQLDAAFSDFNKVAEISKSFPSPSMMRLMALYQIGKLAIARKKDTQIGIDALQEYIQTVPPRQDLPSKAWGKFRLANIYEIDNLNSAANDIYKALIKDNEDEKLIALCKSHLLANIE